MIVAAAAYPIEFLPDWAGYEAKLRGWVADAAGEGADLLVFPEYTAMELAGLGGADVAGDLKRSLDHAAVLAPRAADLHADLARRFKVWILAGSGPVRGGDGQLVNRAGMFAPDGPAGHQDKQIMIPFETEELRIIPGGPLEIFDIADQKIGVNICYDAEFPLLARRQAEAGATLIAVPTCTEFAPGYHRVRIACRARALENQCVTLMAPLIGDAAWCPAVGAGYGAAGIFAPPDGDFPDDGILAEGRLNRPGWTIAEIDPGRIDRARRAGDVRNLRDWPLQGGRITSA